MVSNIRQALTSIASPAKHRLTCIANHLPDPIKLTRGGDTHKTAHCKAPHSGQSHLRTGAHSAGMCRLGLLVGGLR